MAGVQRPLGFAFLARLAASYLVVGGLLYATQPLLGRSLARAARDLILISSWVPHLGDVCFDAGVFQLETLLASGALTLDARPYWFVIAFPVGFAAALPGLRTSAYWRRLLGVLAISLAVDTLLVAVTVDANLVGHLRDTGVLVNPRWRDALVGSMMRRFWELAAIIYPFAACVWLAWGRVIRLPGMRPPAARKPPSTRTTAAAVVVIALALLGIDRLADWRHEHAPEQLFPALQALNPDLGRYLLRRGRKLERARRYDAALRNYQLAARDPLYRPAALRGIARIRRSERSEPDPAR